MGDNGLVPVDVMDADYLEEEDPLHNTSVHVETGADDDDLEDVIDEEEDADAFEEALDDVHSRFILNLPEEEIETTDRLFFQLEQAYWFYDDFYCDQNEALHRFNNLKQFCIKMFSWSPLLEHKMAKFDQLWQEFLQYKRGISTYGTILLSNDQTKVVLCQVYQGKSWTFPSGKVNQGETGFDAAVRETYEETGFDPMCQLGATKHIKQKADAAGESLSWLEKGHFLEQHGLTYIERGTGKRRTCYVCWGVPEDFNFSPVVRKEVGVIEWHPICDLPKRTYAVTPFIGQLKSWIKKSNNRKGGRKDTPKRKKKTQRRKDDELLMESNLIAGPGDEKGWSEEDMFRVNEQMLGRKVSYDGNPHRFEEGFDGQDPHAFRVVGGGLMNAGTSSDAPSVALPDPSGMQPLVQRKDDDDGMDLKPFFSEKGEAPWDELESSAKKVTSFTSPGKSTFAPSTGGRIGESFMTAKSDEEDDFYSATMEVPNANDDVFLTDAEVTAKSQKQKLRSTSCASKDKDYSIQHLDELRQWAQGLSRAPATERFGDFRLNVDAILSKMDKTMAKAVRQ